MRKLLTRIALVFSFTGGTLLSFSAMADNYNWNMERSVKENLEALRENNASRRAANTTRQHGDTSPISDAQRKKQMGTEMDTKFLNSSPAVQEYARTLHLTLPSRIKTRTRDFCDENGVQIDRNTGLLFTDYRSGNGIWRVINTTGRDGYIKKMVRFENDKTIRTVEFSKQGILLADSGKSEKRISKDHREGATEQTVSDQVPAVGCATLSGMARTACDAAKTLGSGLK